ncbi:XRE family transcriptional regulator [Lacrimispora sp.]|uniref:XRE family transcriptional regulator n=1 Tax=Lacrimispora sp. TaxID=2719234 RepID=UPI00285C79DE|nr:XRE family transcriptional regulator [Lacrimispora sp.]MDR7813344.1 XRE family transcriptional regulator [Lacrimispora sp.]
MLSGVEYVRDICKKKGVAVSTLEKECGFSNGYLNPKKLSAIPYNRAAIIAKYLNVDINRILGVEIDLTKKDERDIAKDLKSIMEKLTSGEDGPASYDGEELDPEAAELFRDELEIALKRLKIINKEKYTSKKNKK